MREGLQVVIYKFLVWGTRMPLEITDAHLLARAVISPTKHIDRVVIVLRTVQEPTIRHWCQLNKRKVFQVQYHCVFSACAIIMTAQDNNFVSTDKRAWLCLYWEGELHWHYWPGIIRDIILLNWVNTARSLITPKHVDVALFENDSWHCAPLLIEFSDRLPLVQWNRVSFTAIQYAVNTSATDRVNVVTWVS